MNEDSIAGAKTILIHAKAKPALVMARAAHRNVWKEKGSPKESIADCSVGALDNSDVS